MAKATPVDRPDPGDHARLTYSDPEERLDIPAAFVADGLDRGENVVCYTHVVRIKDLSDELHERTGAGTERPLTVQCSERLWDGGAGPDAEVTVKRLGEELTRTKDEGRPGLPITAGMCWAARPQANAEQVLVFENEVGTLPAEGRLTAGLRVRPGELRPGHPGVRGARASGTVAAAVYHKDPALRICRQHVPPGVRVAGAPTCRTCVCWCVMHNADRLNAARAQPKLRRPNGLPQAAGRMPTSRTATRPVLDQAFDESGLLALRSAVAAYAAELGAGPRVDDMVLIAHELASNAVRHGGGSGRLRLWRDDYRLICRVTDGGTGLADDAATGVEPPPQTPGGRGLWIARRLAAVRIDTGAKGTEITAAILLP